MSITKKERERAEDDLQTIRDLFPGTEVTLQCEEVFKVTPVTVPRLPKLLDALASLADILIAKGFDVDKKGKGKKISKENISAEVLANLPELLRIAGDKVFEILIISTGQPRDWFERVTIVDTMKLFEAILKENDLAEILKNGEGLVEKLGTIFTLLGLEK